MFSHSLKVDSYMVFSLKILQNFTGSLSYFRLLEVIKLNLIVEKTELFKIEMIMINLNEKWPVDVKDVFTS